MGGIRAHAKRLGTSALWIVLLLGMRATDAGAVIGHVQNLGTAFDSTAGATSLALPLTVGAAAGNTVIVSFAMDPAAGVVGCSDTKGNSYTIDANIQDGSGTTGVRTVV